MAASLEYRLERIEILNLGFDVSPELGLERGARTKSQITTNFVYDTRDNPFLTRRGRRISLTPFVAGGFLGGNTQIYGFDLEGSQYYKLPYDMIFLFNAQIASVDTWGDGERVPIFERLFLGGSNNLRGFNFRDVGPKDVNGEPVGGRFLARSTVEVTFPIIEKVRGAVFYDIGVVGLEAFEPNGRAASDVGFGIRLNLPVGPLRLDYGFPITTGGNNKRDGKFNFNVGYQF
jgi:outer membrane protein insertion porin family